MKNEIKKIKVYCETTVVGDMTSRLSPLIRNLARQMATREWWEAVAPQSEFYVSQLVALESARGDGEAAKRRKDFLANLNWLEYGLAALDLARKFLAAAAIPETSFDDATHVAIATVSKMDCIATWNCRHINNPQTMPRIIAVCEQNGFRCHLIGTPEQLKEVYDENDGTRHP